MLARAEEASGEVSEHTLRREGKVRIKGEAATYLQISLSDQNTASDD